jgi:hypothetical protein
LRGIIAIFYTFLYKQSENNTYYPGTKIVLHSVIELPLITPEQYWQSVAVLPVVETVCTEIRAHVLQNKNKVP